jgi:glucose-1-phosphate adenylyltransferase
MKDVFGMIYTSDESDVRLRDLTRSRSIAAMPIGGRYRVIDVLLSNMVHSQITNVGLITQRNYHSLMDHLESGKAWDLNRKRDGLFILPPYVTRGNTGSYSGMLDAIRSNLGYVRRSAQRYALISGSSTVFNMKFDDMMKKHLETGADITILYNVPAEGELVSDAERTHLKMDEDGRVVDIEVSPHLHSYPNVSMDVYIMDKALLTYLVEVSAAHYRTDFVRDVLLKQLSELKVYGYRYDGYVSRIESISSYYKLNMDMLSEEIRTPLLYRPNPVYTKVKDEVPARYEANAKAVNSLVADGCIIEGTVENSVLFRGVRVGKGAVVKDCILMQGVEVQDGAQLSNVISDKDAFIKRDRRIVGQESYPVVIEKNAVI